jgi:serine/threonine-protein kinase
VTTDDGPALSAPSGGAGPGRTRLLGGRYEVGAVIGRGGMADVHTGHDTRLGRPVAIKLLRSDLARDTNFLARFRREAQSAAGLNHPSIVAIYDSGEDTSTDSAGAVVQVPYIVMERLEGATLRERLTRSGPLEPAEAARITEGVLGALAYSHRMGIVHRDIKPANVMITQTGEVKVMDFGIARAVADSAATMTQTQAVIGTAQYLSPEQAQGKTVDARSDLYSTGCLLFELLTGRPPFVGETPVAIAYQHVGEAPTRPSAVRRGVPAAYDAVVLHAMEKDRERRYQSAIDFRADLVCAREGSPVSDQARASLAGLGPVGSAAGIPGTAAATQVLDPVPPPLTRAQARSRAEAARRGEPAAFADDPLEGPADGLGRAGDGGIGNGYGNGNGNGNGNGGSVRRRSAGWVLAGLATLAILGLVFFVVRPALTPAAPAQVSVPHLIGQTQAAARTLVEAKKLFLQVELVLDAASAPDTVIDQDPKEGVQVTVGSSVRVKVSTGPGSATIPSVVGSNKDVAATSLRLLGFGDPQIVPADDPAQPKDAVIKVDPPVGSVVPKTQPITLTVSTGKVKMPPLVGKHTDTAQGIVEGLHLVYARGEQVPTSDPAVLEGTVLGQDVAPDTLVDQGTKITVKIAVRAAATTTVTITPSTPPPPPTSSGTVTSSPPRTTRP